MVELAHVQVMGIVRDVHADIIIVEKEEDECILCRKVFKSNRRNLSHQVIPGHMVEVYGKIRLLEDKTPLCRSWKLSRQCVGCRNYSTKRIHLALPGGTHCKVPERKGPFPNAGPGAIQLHF